MDNKLTVKFQRLIFVQTVFFYLHFEPMFSKIFCLWSFALKTFSTVPVETFCFLMKTTEKQRIFRNPRNGKSTWLFHIIFRSLVHSLVAVVESKPTNANNWIQFSFYTRNYVLHFVCAGEFSQHEHSARQQTKPAHIRPHPTICECYIHRQTLHVYLNNNIFEMPFHLVCLVYMAVWGYNTEEQHNFIGFNECLSRLHSGFFRFS